MKKQYVILECGETAGFDFHKCQVYGPYPSIRHCREWIRQDAFDNWNADTGTTVPGADTEWGSRFLICQVGEMYRPVPVVSLKVEIRRVK